MKASIFYFVFSAVLALVAMSAILPDALSLQDGAFYALWAGMVTQFALVSALLWRATQTEAEMTAVFKGAGLEPVPELIDVVRVALMAIAILANGWYLTAIAYLSTEVSAIIIYKSIRWFVAMVEREEAIDFTAPAANDNLKSRDAA